MPGYLTQVAVEGYNNNKTIKQVAADKFIY